MNRSKYRLLVKGIILCFAVSGCSSGQEICCGYRTVEDTSSDVSISDADGVIKVQRVSAIIYLDNAFIIEISEPIRESNPLAFYPCHYKLLSKTNGVISDTQQWNSTKLRNYINRQKDSVFLMTSRSCIEE